MNEENFHDFNLSLISQCNIYRGIVIKQIHSWSIIKLINWKMFQSTSVQRDNNELQTHSLYFRNKTEKRENTLQQQTTKMVSLPNEMTVEV